jgi:holo-[acyl-carrier protein] synthase
MLSIGTDIVKIDRIKSLYKNSKFLNKIFTFSEIEYCNNHKDPYIHLSGKYAAKEAIKKALLSAKLVKSIPINHIEVLNNKNKSPYINLVNLNNIKCNVSISHDGDYAIAFVIIEK